VNADSVFAPIKHARYNLRLILFNLHADYKIKLLTTLVLQDHHGKSQISNQHRSQIDKYL